MRLSNNMRMYLGGLVHKYGHEFPHCSETKCGVLKTIC